MREAMYYQPQAAGAAACGLCPKGCMIGEGGAGFCRVRKNTGGKLFTENYGQVSSYALDPIEKKPLYHFYPGSYILSLGTWGCNFSCRFCQNWQISQTSPHTLELLPEAAVRLAREQGEKNIGLAFTYSEPTVWYEYILDTAQACRRQGLKTVLVTNGYINPEPLDKLLPYIDAMNIDVKAFNPEFYRQICAGSLADVKQTVERAAGRCHVEITTLLIPGLNDGAGELKKLAQWLSGIDPAIPLHFSRYFPNYRLDVPPTPLDTMEQAREVAGRFLSYVYLGNVGLQAGNTYCPDCGCLVIDRTRRQSLLTGDKKCPQCGSLSAITGEIRY
ncbi:MAG: AmmeMemoRadiSam system radical SAM enzyme [Veillonellales bacterium]